VRKVNDISYMEAGRLVVLFIVVNHMDYLGC
jgi:hypothetical protein